MDNSRAPGEPRASQSRPAAESLLVLSLFPGAGLLDRGFTLAGYCVVRGPDTLLGGDIRDFHAARGHFVGVIGGPPCQDFSRKRRTPPTGHGRAMLAEFARVVTEATPEWWLMENVPTVPTVNIPGWITQRLHLNALECGLNQDRLRCFQFGSRDGVPIRPKRLDVSHIGRTTPTVTAKDARSHFRRLCDAQGVPRGITFAGMSRTTRQRLVGNGVPVPMAEVIAQSITDRHHTCGLRLCACGCGRYLDGPARQRAATPTCRKRLQRLRAENCNDPGSPLSSALDTGQGR